MLYGPFFMGEKPPFQAPFIGTIQIATLAKTTKAAISISKLCFLSPRFSTKKEPPSKMMPPSMAKDNKRSLISAVFRSALAPAQTATQINPLPLIANRDLMD